MKGCSTRRELYPVEHDVCKPSGLVTVLKHPMGSLPIAKSIYRVVIRVVIG